MKDEKYKQDDAYVYADKSGDIELIGLATVLIIFAIGFIILKLK